MEEKTTYIGTWELASIVVAMSCTQIFLNLPRIVSETAGTAGWIVMIYVSVVCLVLITIFFSLYKNFWGKDLMDIAETFSGKAGRIVTGIIYAGFLMMFVSVVLREFSENMKIITLSLSPISYVTFFFTAGIIIAAYSGLEPIARVTAIAAPIITVGFFIIIFASTQNMDMSHIMPVFGFGISNIFINGFSRLSIYSTIILIFFLAPYIKTYKSFRKASYMGVLLASSFLISICFVYLSVFQYPVSLENFLPVYQMARLINYGRFIQRIESVFLLIWVMAALLYLSFGFYLILMILRKTFNIQYYKPLILPLSILLFTLSLIPENLVSAIRIDSDYLTTYGWIIAFGFTGIILITANIKKKLKDRKGVKK